jgi:hypothetical protein
MKMTNPLSWKTYAGLTLALATLLLFPSAAAQAQTQETTKPASEVDQLKQRLQQLEQIVVEEDSRDCRSDVFAAGYTSGDTRNRAR